MGFFVLNIICYLPPEKTLCLQVEEDSQKKKNYWTCCLNNIILDLFQLSLSIVARNKPFNPSQRLPPMKSGESFILWDFSMIIHMKAFLKFAKYQKVKWGTHAKHELWRKSRIQFLAKKPMCDLSDLTKDGFYLAGLTTDNCPPYFWLGTQPVSALASGGGCRQGRPPPGGHTYTICFFSVSLGQKVPFGRFLAWILFCPLTQYAVLLHPWPFLLHYSGTQDRTTDSSFAGDTAAELAWGVRLDLIQEFQTSWRVWPNLEH